MCKISFAPNFAPFWPPIFLNRAPKFWDLDNKTGILPITSQSFTAIGRQSSEISC